MPTEPTWLKWFSTYKIEVCNESGFKSLLETGVNSMYKEEYLQEHINYLQYRDSRDHPRSLSVCVAIKYSCHSDDDFVMLMHLGRSCIVACVPRDARSYGLGWQPVPRRLRCVCRWVGRHLGHQYPWAHRATVVCCGVPTP